MQIDKLIEQGERWRPTTVDQLTSMAYLTEFGIMPEKSGPHTNPFGVVGYYEKEDFLEGSELYSYIRRFHRLKINSSSGLSLLEFMELPKHVADLLIEIAQSEYRETNDEFKSLKDNLEDKK